MQEAKLDYRLLMLALGTFAIGTDNYVVAGILPHVARSFDVSVAAAGQFVTIYSFAYALSTPITATLTANWPRRRVLIVGLIVFVAGNILTATQQTYDLGLVSRAVAGLGGAMVTPAAGAAAAAMVAPEWRGRALAIVLAGLSGATALGAPIGTLVGSFGDWRMTMWFVAGLGTLASVGVLAALPGVPTSSPLQLRDRLAPLGDARVAATLATTVLTMFGIFLIYTYISVVFDRATGGDGERLAALLSSWGIGATVGILGAGSLTDRFGNRRIINLAILITALDFALIPWSSTNFATAIIALCIWGMCGWGLVVSQQHRLVGIAPTLTPILIALNAAAIYFAVSASGAVGALAMKVLDPHDLPFLSAILILAGILSAEMAHRLIQDGKTGIAWPSQAAEPTRR
jgi:MFS transporter, DHA1 family, inner membrane transport protein